MTEEPQDIEYFELFKPKSEPSEEGEPQTTGSGARQTRIDQPADNATRAGETKPSGDQAEIPLDRFQEIDDQVEYESLIAASGGSGNALRTIGIFFGGGCLLLVLVAVVAFAFFRIFVRKDVDDEVLDTPVPTVAATLTPRPTPAVTESPLFVPFVNSTDVRVPVAFPERLYVGETAFSVQAVQAPTGAWPQAPITGDTVNWAYGTVVNYILGLAPTAENRYLLSSLRAGDPALSLHMSSGIILNFTVESIVTGADNETALMEQASPRLTLALLTDDPSQRTVVTGTFSSDAADESGLLSGAAIGLIGTPVDQGPARITLIETYQVAAGEAGLPPGTGYFLVDLRVENVGATVLEPGFFQTFLSDTSGARFPLTLMAEQFAHYGIPTQPLRPGETVIGSLGYLVPGSPDDQIRWAFNPLPGSEYWVIVPVSYDLPVPSPTLEAPPVGFARVTVDSNDVFVDRGDGLLDIGLRIENISEGVVHVTGDDISLSSWADGEVTLVAPAPLLPWTVGPGELRVFQLQFQLPTADTALLTVLGYSFSIENLGVE